VVAGKGQFTCGAKGCDQKQALESFEVPFAYLEAQKQKQALVKASAHRSSANSCICFKEHCASIMSSKILCGA